VGVGLPRGERDPDPDDYPDADPDDLVAGSAVFRSPDREVSLQNPNEWGGTSRPRMLHFRVARTRERAGISSRIARWFVTE
jgi:hypothetical protein